MSDLLTVHPPQYDDLFVYAPSFTLYEELALEGREHLFEGKYIGTARESDLEFMNNQATMDAFLFPERYANERRKGATVGKRRFKQVKARTQGELLQVVQDHDRGETWDTDFRKDATAIMKKAWREVFLAGVRASGMQGEGHGKTGVQLTPHDEKWFKSAVQHEMRFLNGFMAAVTEQTYKMPLDRRVGMYMDALEAFYDSARVMGMPSTSLIRWTGKKDNRVCKSCQYIKRHNPFHKNRLPTVPRSGLTICLTNCRDRLLIRVVDTDTALAELVRRPTKQQMLGHLRRLKRGAA